MRRRIGAALAPVLLVAWLVACDTTPGGVTPAPGSTSTVGDGVTFDPPASIGPPPSPTPDAASPVVLDPTLLAVLPESIDGAPVTESSDEAALALTDPGLPRIATALYVGVAIDIGTGDLVTAHVVKLRPEAFTDGTFAQWRDSYDEGACAGAGGVTGRAEATIDERTVYVTSCVAEQRAYHVWLEEQDTLVSASSIGDGRFGEKLMDNLRVPA